MITSYVCISSLNLQPTGFTKKYMPLRTNYFLRRKMPQKELKQKDHKHTQLTESPINANNQRGAQTNLWCEPHFSSFLFNIPILLSYFLFHRMMTLDRQKPFYPLGSLSHLQKNEEPPKCPHRRYSNHYTAWPTAELSSLLLTTSY